MARPLKTNAAYFSHDADMRNNRKVKALRARFGLEGYAVWSMLLECLTDADGFELEWDALGIELVSGDLGLDADRLQEITGYMDRIGLIEIIEGKLQCAAHLARMQFVLDERERKRRWKHKVSGVIDGENHENAGENAQRKLKEIKLKEIKGKRESKALAQNDLSETEKNAAGEAPGISGAGAAPDQFAEVRNAIVTWAKPDEFAALRALADKAGYDPAKHGPVSDEVTKFTSYWLDLERAEDSRSLFIIDPPAFFQSKAIKWLTDAKRFNKRSKNSTTPPSNAAKYEPPARGFYNDRDKRERSRTDPTPLSILTQ